MGNTSKLNLILILVTILSLGIAVGVLIKDKKSENNTIDKEMTVASEVKDEPVEESKAYDTPMGYAEPIAEYQMTAQSNPFNNSLDSPETGEYVKSILLEYFAYEANQSRLGTIYKPFEDKIHNLPSTIDYSQYGYGKATPPPEVQKILENSTQFPYDVIELITNNLQLVNCEKTVSYNSKIQYTCSLILNTLDGTGLDSEINRVPTNFEVKLIQVEVGYSVESFK